MKIPLLDEYHNEVRTPSGVKMVQAYTVWVDGTEVNDYLLDKANADMLAQEYINAGYTGVSVEKAY